MGKADYKKRELMDNGQDALLEYKELVGVHNAGKKKQNSIQDGVKRCLQETIVERIKT